MHLLMATSAFRLDRRQQSSHQQYYLYRLRTIRLSTITTILDILHKSYTLSRKHRNIENSYGCLTPHTEMARTGHIHVPVFQFTRNKGCLQCFDAVGWVAGRASGLQKLSGEVLAWLSVWSEVQMICIWSSWCHSHPIFSCSSKIQNYLPFWCRLTQDVLEKRSLNVCSSSAVDRE